VSKTWLSITAAAAVAAAALSCGGRKAPPAVPFENAMWGIKLEYPGDWDARAGKGAAALILEVRAPDGTETAGAGVSVVGAFSAASLGAVASSLKRKIGGPRGVVASDVAVGGRRGKAFEYYAVRGGERVWTRALVVRGNERYYFITFAAYEGRREAARPYFDAIERSVEIY
jgi:hypothetical protein